MTSHKKLKLGAVCELQQDNNTHNTNQGQWLAIIAVNADGKKADAHVFATEAEAKAAATFATAANPSGAAPTPAKVLNQVGYRRSGGAPGASSAN